MKTKLLILLSIIFLVIWFTIGLISYKNDEIVRANDSYNYALKLYEDAKCNNNEDERCKKLYKNLDKAREKLNFNEPGTYSHIAILSFRENSAKIELIQVIGIIFIIIPAMIGFYSKVKNGSIKNFLMRESYAKFIKKNYLASIKCTLIFPTFLIITLFITICVYRFKIGLNPNEINLSRFYDEGEYITKYWFQNFAIMLFLVTIYSGYYINLAYIAFYKIKNFILNIILAFIFFIINEIAIFPLLGIILYSVFNNDIGEKILYSLPTSSMWIFSSNNNYWYIPMIVAITLYIITFVIVILLYKNKERFLIYNEN